PLTPRPERQGREHGLLLLQADRRGLTSQTGSEPLVVGVARVARPESSKGASRQSAPFEDSGRAAKMLGQELGKCMNEPATTPDYLRALFPRAGTDLLQLLAGAAENASLLRTDFYTIRDLADVSGYTTHEPLPA